MRRSDAVQVGLRYNRGVKVLVVEDEATLSQHIADALGASGYAVDCAFDGERADFLNRTEHYDAVILDLGLPKIDGLTLLRGWRTAGLAVPVLVLTARGSWHEKVQGFDGGADDYVSKPFQIEEVLARLRALIRRATGQVGPELRSGDVAARTLTRTMRTGVVGEIKVSGGRMPDTVLVGTSTIDWGGSFRVLRK